MTEIDDELIVLSSLQTAGIDAGEAEVETMVAEFAKTRATMRTLYLMSGVRYEEPALSFDPLP